MGGSANILRLGGYTLLARIDIGDSSEIYLAQKSDSSDSSETVIIKKFLHLQIGSDFHAGFLQRMQQVSSLKSRHWVEILDYGIDGDSCYLVMEQLIGFDLQYLLERLSEQGERVPLEQTIHLAISILSALAVAHACSETSSGIPHQNLSSSSVFLTKSGRVKLLGLGTARALQIESMNKVAYMSPEQCQNGAAVYQNDIYAVGTILYELVTGLLPFTAVSVNDLISKIVEAKINSPSESAELPRIMEKIILKCMAKSPTNRFASVSDIQEGIDFFVEQEQLLSSEASMATYLQSYPVLNEEEKTEQTTLAKLKESADQQVVTRSYFSPPVIAAAPSIVKSPLRPSIPVAQKVTSAGQPKEFSKTTRSKGFPEIKTEAGYPSSLPPPAMLPPPIVFPDKMKPTANTMGIEREKTAITSGLNPGHSDPIESK